MEEESLETFDEHPNTLIYETMLPDDMDDVEKRHTGYEKTLPQQYTNNLSLVSAYYIYTGTPPLGFGTQAPKVAETVIRTTDFNLKPNSKIIQLAGYDVARVHWDRDDGPFPFDQIHSNFIPSEMKTMVMNFTKTYYGQIDASADKVVRKMLHTNSDVLTKGRQTFCPFSEQSVTAAVAYTRMYDFLSKNTGELGMSCLDWLKAFMSLFGKPSIEYMKNTEIEEISHRFDRKTRQHIKLVTKKMKMVKTKTRNGQETDNVLLGICTKFASYLKHKERGKISRRAICSPNMIMRMFLYAIEEFHLDLARGITGSTISIGGEEKKAKITNNLSDNHLIHTRADVVVQGTEDATKWNECLSPASFALMHKFMFDQDARTAHCIPLTHENGRVLSEIARIGNLLLSFKEVQIGLGVKVEDEKSYSRIRWRNEDREKMNGRTREWYDRIQNQITDDRNYFRSSSGMLMGMMNAASTTLGLLAVNHRMNPETMRVVTLRSSDDSMSTYLANNIDNCKISIELNRRNLAMIGINLSQDKTFFYKEGYGEYTSWYTDGSFVSQYGVETSSIRPQGKNPADDFFSVAKSTAVALATLTLNPLGASCRIRLGIDGVRRLWRIHRKREGREGVGPDVLMLSDGGDCLWNCMNSHLEEAAMKEKRAISVEEQEYLLRVRNPENPFNEEAEEEVTYSKEFGMLTTNEVETPRTVFNYVRRSNRTVKTKVKETQVKREKEFGEAMKIIRAADPTVLVDYPTSGTRISDHITALITTQRTNVTLDESEQGMYEEALRFLKTGERGGDDEDYFEEFLDLDDN